MKTQFTILLCFIALLCARSLNAQSTNYTGHVTLLRAKPEFTYNLGYSIFADNAKRASNMPNMMQSGIGIYLPLLKGKNPSKTNFGLNASGSYMFGSTKTVTANYQTFNLIMQTGAPQTSIANNNNSKINGFLIDFGPQAHFNWTKFSVVPALNLGFLNLMQNAISINQTTFDASNVAQSYIIAKQNKIATNGLAIIPKLKLVYYTGKVGFWIEGSYTFAPKSTIQNEVLQPLGPPTNNVYENIQLQQGSFKSQTTTINNNFATLNAGLSFCLCASPKSNFSGF